LHTEIFSINQLEFFEKLKTNKEFLDKYGFYLFGGTGLALQVGHRKSEDFDFMTSQNFDPNKLEEEFKEIFGECEITQIEKNTLSLSWKGVLVSFFGGIKHLIITENSNIEVNIYSCDDILAMKIGVLFSRSILKDYFDLSYFLKYEGYTVAKLIELFRQKYPEKVRDYSIQLILKYLTYINDVSVQNLEILKYTDFWLKPDLKTNIQKVLQQSVNNYFLQS